MKREAVDRNIGEVRRMITERLAEHAAAYYPRDPENGRWTGMTQNRQTTSARPARTGADGQRPAAAFENKAGRYELARVENGQAFYSFTNRHGKTVDAVMPVAVWLRLEAKGG